MTKALFYVQDLYETSSQQKAKWVICLSLSRPRLDELTTQSLKVLFQARYRGSCERKIPNIVSFSLKALIQYQPLIVRDIHLVNSESQTPNLSWRLSFVCTRGTPFVANAIVGTQPNKSFTPIGSICSGRTQSIL
jgi:hypothetical protein